MRTALKLEYQVTTLIAAIACIAFIGNACLETSQPALIPDAKFDARLSEASVRDEIFSRPASAVEFAAVYGLAVDKPYTTLAAAEWSSPQAKADEAPAAKPLKKAILAAQACSGGCRLPSASTKAPVIVPPPRPANLTITAQAPARDEDKRVRLLGLSLPGFVPSREKIARTVVSWGGSIAGVVPGL